MAQKNNKILELNLFGMSLFKLDCYGKKSFAKLFPAGCLTSDTGPDLEPILTPDSPKRREAFEKAYRVGPIIGKGGFGKVFAGERLKDRLPVAIKHINKTKISSWCTVST